MELKTQIHANPDQQDLTITREFDLPLQVLFKAYEEPEIVEYWMGTKVVKLENKPHGSWHFITTDPKGNAHGFNGTIHEFIPGKKITRTFEMENSPFPVQLEFLEFEALGIRQSRLTMHIIYRSVTYRDQMLRLPFAQGISLAHDRIQQYFSN